MSKFFMNPFAKCKDRLLISGFLNVKRFSLWADSLKWICLLGDPWLAKDGRLNRSLDSEFPSLLSSSLMNRYSLAGSSAFSRFFKLLERIMNSPKLEVIPPLDFSRFTTSGSRLSLRILKSCSLASEFRLENSPFLFSVLGEPLH